MDGDVGAWSVEPVANPGLRDARRRRLMRMTKEQIAGRTGPLRQVRYRDQVVSPLALELECRKLLQRAQRAIATIVTSSVYAGDLRGAVEEPVLRQHEWEIAVALREITELLLELVSSGLSREDAYALVQAAAMETWDTQTPFRDSLIAQGKKRNMVLDEVALDRAFRAEDYVARLGHVFDRLATLS